MWKIIEHLYLTDQYGARDLTLMKEARISHVVNCTGGVVPCGFQDELRYLSVSISEDSFAQQMDEVFSFLDSAITEGNTLVHCSEARERSPAVIIAYLCHKGRTVDEALKMLQEATSSRSQPFHPPPYHLMRWIIERFD